MLKIEVIKFEAQDVITASVAECICPSNERHYQPNGSGVDWDHGNCPFEGSDSDHNCPNYVA